MDEEWCPILDFEHYSVSTFGQVRNERTGRMMAQSLTPAGASKVGFHYDGRQHVRSVKGLVAQAFVDGQTSIFDTPINLDGDLTNNHVWNIVWRPRWFALKYARQTKQPGRLSYLMGPIDNHNTGERHKTIFEAALRDGVLCDAIHKGINEGIEVFPNWHRYSLVRR